MPVKTITLSVLLSGALLLAQDKPSDMPQPRQVTQEDMIRKIGEDALILEAKDRYIETLQRKITELQAQAEVLKKPKP